MNTQNTAEALNCTNCGGAVTSDTTKCKFCGSRLKTVGCRACLGMMFLGSKFCGRCGAAAYAAELIDESEPGTCPRCKIKLLSLKIGAVAIRECERCGGFWSGVKTFENICIDKEKQASILGFSGSYIHENAKPAAIAYVPCPDCSQLMNRSNFARSSGVIIDTCKQHGIWFDAGELPKIIEFIEGGGIDRAREKERVEMQDERSRLRDEERRLAMIARRSGVTGNARSAEGEGFLSILFD